ncbi:MAG: RAD55 family ATPase [Candidatus Hodarchaeales archaeon]
MESEDAFRTGVQSLDLFLGGEDNPGLPNRSVILVLGEPGTKFELFTQQILYRIMKTGATDKVLYLSYDGRPQEIVEEMAIYDFQIQPYIDNNKQWEFMDAFTARIVAEGAVIGLQSIPGSDVGSEYAQDSLRYFTRSFIPKMLEYEKICTCIHSASSLIRNNSMESVSIAIETLKHIVRERESGIHFIMMVKNLHGTEIEVLSSHLADFVFDISFGRVGAGKINIDFSVQKSWKSILLPISVPVTIDKRGIRLETTVRI